MKLSSNQIFVALFFFLSLILLFLNLRDASLIINPYTFGGWLITYTGQGFEYILGGELIFFLKKFIPLEITKLFILINFLMYFFVICTLIKKYFFLSNDIKILCLFFPTSFIFLVLEPGLVGRLEVVLFTHVSCIYLFLSNKKNYIPNNYFYLLNGLILGILLFFHISFFTFTPLIFLMILKFLKINYSFKILIEKFLLFYIPQILTLVIFFYFLPEAGKVNLELIYERLPNNISEVLANYCSKSGSGYICYLNKSQNEIAWTFSGVSKFFYISSLILNILINSLFLIFFFSLQKFKFNKIDYLIIWYLLLYLLLFLKISDWARYFFIQNMIFLIFLNEDKIKKINFKILFFTSIYLSLLLIPHGVSNKFSMGLINSSNFLTNKITSLVNMIF